MRGEGPIPGVKYWYIFMHPQNLSEPGHSPAAVRMFATRRSVDYHFALNAPSSAATLGS